MLLQGARGQSLRRHLLFAHDPGHPGRLSLQRGAVVVAEVPSMQAADVHDTEQTTVRDQRNAEHRGDAVLPQDRVHHGVRTDIVEHDRGPRRRDLPGEAHAEGYPDALADLVLETARRAGDQLRAIAVHQQDRRRVGPEQLLDVLQQHVQDVRQAAGGRPPCRRSDRRHRMVPGTTPDQHRTSKGSRELLRPVRSPNERPAAAAVPHGTSSLSKTTRTVSHAVERASSGPISVRRAPSSPVAIGSGQASVGTRRATG